MADGFGRELCRIRLFEGGIIYLRRESMEGSGLMGTKAWREDEIRW